MVQSSQIFAHDSGFVFAQLEMSTSTRSALSYVFINHFSEVVLSVLIKNFEFSLSEKNKDIVWETPGISSPSITADGKKITQLPLVIKAVKSK